ncbi:MAG: hypothetical protein KAG80_06225 [Nocardioides sp.]|nr:hypothetical protein [Nocardioides sp.]
MTARWIVDFPIPQDGLPIGPTTPLPGRRGKELTATYVRWPVPYVLISAPRGINPGVPCPERDRTLEAVRRYVAGRAELSLSPAVPKIGLVAVDEAQLCFTTRMSYGQGWHPKVASSGLMALAVALIEPESVPARLAGPLRDTSLVLTPAGERRISCGTDADGHEVIRLALGAVDTKDGAA